MAIVIILIYLAIVHRRADELRDFIKIFSFTVFVVLIFLISEISIEGQRGRVSGNLLQEVVVSIFVDTGVESLDGSRSDRLLWWSNVIERTASTAPSFFFGMGLHTVLLDRSTGENTIIRYPHNSFVSVFGLEGIIGFTLYVAIILLAIKKIFKASLEREAIPLLKWYPVFAIGYLVAAFFSTVFEAPFHSFVFWVITGVVYRIANQDNLKRVALL